MLNLYLIFVRVMLLKLTKILSHAKRFAFFVGALVIVMTTHASLGLGKKRSATGSKKMLSSKVVGFNGNFSLKSGYNFRGKSILDNKTPQVIQLNTEIIAQKGNFTFTIPLRKQVLVKSIKIGLGNETLRSH